jgi:nicotinamidase-related amidase
MTSHKDFIKKMEKIDKKMFFTYNEVQKNDCLFVIDMQNDFLDRPYKEEVGTFSRPGQKNKQVIKHKKGKLPTIGSRKIVKAIAGLVDYFNIAVATRDYHPVKPDHCSFPIFGEHCIWNTRGSDIASEINKKFVNKNGTLKKRRHIVFKAFNHKIDSFGAFKYTRKEGKDRICGCTKNYCPSALTGSFALKGKYTQYPDLKKRKVIDILQVLKKEKVSKQNSTLFICGVLGDFCVLDTAKNARKAGFQHVVIIVDLIRSLRLKKKDKIVYPTTPKMFINEAKKHKFMFMKSENLNVS